MREELEEPFKRQVEFLDAALGAVRVDDAHARPGEAQGSLALGEVVVEQVKRAEELEQLREAEELSTPFGSLVHPAEGGLVPLKELADLGRVCEAPPEEVG